MAEQRRGRCHPWTPQAALHIAEPALRLPALPAVDGAALAADKTAAAAFSCVSGHAAEAGHTTDHKYPHWPAEVHYYGLGKCSGTVAAVVVVMAAVVVRRWQQQQQWR